MGFLSSEDKPGPTWTARFDGVCADCGNDIDAHLDEVRWSSTRQVIHADCDAYMEKEGIHHQRPERVCPRCFLTSCDCERSTSA